ncbi:DUF6098 family protein [Rhodococcus sp. O3]|uniref:DUF6098 family protein n=1 Tax=Rhodococcus sp. O3 TaxID=3404919 RepID=UPI003B681893
MSIDSSTDTHAKESDLPTITTIQELTDLVTSTPHIMLRYSRGPSHDADGGGSRDYESGVDMPGVSVTTLAPESWWPRPAVDWVARRVCKYLELEDSDRYPWVLTGNVVGHGPDHEPLVADFRPIARLAPSVLEDAKALYRSRFDMGNDSSSED